MDPARALPIFLEAIAAQGASGEPFTPESDLELFRELVSRSERAMLESEHPPSLLDIERLLKIKRQLGTLETIEELQALARGES